MQGPRALGCRPQPALCHGAGEPHPPWRPHRAPRRRPWGGRGGHFKPGGVALLTRLNVKEAPAPPCCGGGGAGKDIMHRAMFLLAAQLVHLHIFHAVQILCPGRHPRTPQRFIHVSPAQLLQPAAQTFRISFPFFLVKQPCSVDTSKSLPPPPQWARMRAEIQKLRELNVQKANLLTHKEALLQESERCRPTPRHCGPWGWGGGQMHGFDFLGRDFEPGLCGSDLIERTGRRRHMVVTRVSGGRMCFAVRRPHWGFEVAR